MSQGCISRQTAKQRTEAESRFSSEPIIIGPKINWCDKVLGVGYPKGNSQQNDVQLGCAGSSCFELNENLPVLKNQTRALSVARWLQGEQLLANLFWPLRPPLCPLPAMLGFEEKISIAP